MSRKIILLGATSAIMRHVALRLVAQGDLVCLAARNVEEAERIGADLRIRTGAAAVTVRAFDTSDFQQHKALVEDVARELGGIDIVIAGTGELGDQEAARHSVERTKAIIDSNFTGIATAFSVAADIMEAQGRGSLVVLSSVAGERGRQSNYTYGAAKSGMAAFMQGLRNRLWPAGVRVVTIKLGFINTRMVAGKAGMFLVAEPEDAATRIAAAVDSGSEVVYFPFFWRYIMLVIRSIPETFFKRLKL